MCLHFTIKTVSAGKGLTSPAGLSQVQCNRNTTFLILFQSGKNKKPHPAMRLLWALIAQHSNPTPKAKEKTSPK
jgi:hypothetical protein